MNVFVKLITPLRIVAFLFLAAAIYYYAEGYVNTRPSLYGGFYFAIISAVFIAIDALLLLVKRPKARMVWNSVLCAALLGPVVLMMVS